MNYLLCICMSMDNMLRNVTYFKRSDHPKWTRTQLSLDLSEVSDLWNSLRWTWFVDQDWFKSETSDKCMGNWVWVQNFVGQILIDMGWLNGTGLQLAKQIFPIYSVMMGYYNNI